MKPDRHALQLCSQVAETLHLVLLDSEDDDLRDLLRWRDRGYVTSTVSHPRWPGPW